MSIYFYARVTRYSVQPTPLELKYLRNLASSSRSRSTRSIALPQPVTQYRDSTIRTAPYSGSRVPGARSRTKRLSDERVSATAGHGYHVVTRGGCRVRRYRRVPVAVWLLLLWRYLQRTIIERRRRRMLTFPVPA